jgi:hypothetical protein
MGIQQAPLQILIKMGPENCHSSTMLSIALNNSKANIFSQNTFTELSILTCQFPVRVHVFILPRDNAIIYVLLKLETITRLCLMPMVQAIPYRQ